MRTWDTQLGAMIHGNTFVSLNILYLLMEKGLISQQEAAGVFTTAANQVREGSEDGAKPQFGEATAQALETMAGWCLGLSREP
jgi:hypothetical protein